MAAQTPSRTVQTQNGPIIGIRIVNEGDRKVDAFRGIPFAKPPLGDLRFRKPVPPDSWSEQRQCIGFGPRGMQKDSPYAQFNGETSDDQLYLNVFTPVWPCTEGSNGFPVMAYVHGGAFVSDSTHKYGDIGIAQHLVQKDVIVVTIQYRLGYLGFFSTGDNNCVDNLGLWDMTFALRWVQDNITAFGGNAGNVTLFGQSAGGVSVDLLSLSPHSRDLFHKVCPMAGNANCDFALHDNAPRDCRAFVEKFGVVANNSQDLIAQLRQSDKENFAVAMQISTASVANISTEIGPRMDGNFFPKSLAELRREASKKPRLVGTCQMEGLLLLLLNREPVTLAKLEASIAELIPHEPFLDDYLELRQQALAMYIGPEDHNNPGKLAAALAKFYSDIFLNNATQAHVQEQLEVVGNASTFMYSFDYCNPNSFGVLGQMMPFKAATHCTELAYLFAVGIISPFQFNEDDNKMLDMMTSWWTNFAKYGDPNGHGLANATSSTAIWPPVNNNQPSLHMSIKPQPEWSDVYQNGRPLFWNGIQNRRLQYAHDKTGKGCRAGHSKVHEGESTL